MIRCESGDETGGCGMQRQRCSSAGAAFARSWDRRGRGICDDGGTLCDKTKITARLAWTMTWVDAWDFEMSVGAWLGRASILIAVICLDIAVRCDAQKPINLGGARRRDVYIAGFFPYGSHVPEGHVGRGVMPSVKLAVDHINENANVLRNYRLHMWWNDTEVSTTLCFILDSTSGLDATLRAHRVEYSDPVHIL